MFSAINIASSGMTANKDWLEVTSNNIANMNTTRTEDGGPYKRQSVSMEAVDTFDTVFNKQMGGGVEISKVSQDDEEILTYDPAHPDANEDGFVAYPSINLSAEITNLMQAQRSYEAGTTSLNSIKQAMQKELEIGKL